MSDRINKASPMGASGMASVFSFQKPVIRFLAVDGRNGAAMGYF